MNRACRTNGGERNVYKTLMGKPEGKEHNIILIKNYILIK
jgi:hypothetical protein